MRLQEASYSGIDPHPSQDQYLNQDQAILYAMSIIFRFLYRMEKYLAARDYSDQTGAGLSVMEYYDICLLRPELTIFKE